MKRIVFALLLAPASLVAQVIDFEADALGATPRAWSIAMTHDGGAPRWQVERDPTSQSGSKVLAQLSDDRTSGRFPLAIYEADELTNGAIRVWFKPISGRVDQAAGLVWRYVRQRRQVRSVDQSR